MSYPKIDAPLRTNESLRNTLDVDHHKDHQSTLLMIFLLPTHYNCLMRKCLLGWISGEFNYHTKWTSLQMNSLSEYLVNSNEF